MKHCAVLAFAAAGLCAAIVAAAPSAITVHTASWHPMRYHLALPAGWSADREWPVLIAIPDAGRQFDTNLQTFVAARGARPYILVAPEVLTCGGARSRTLDHYSYSQAVWDSLQRIDDFAFDDGGIAAVLADVQRQWHGETKAFPTGWEAGGHTVWAVTFRHPERWRGVAPVSTNYQRRGLDPASFSSAPERLRLPPGVPRRHVARRERRFDEVSRPANRERARRRAHARFQGRSSALGSGRGPRPAGPVGPGVVRLAAGPSVEGRLEALTDRIEGRQLFRLTRAVNRLRTTTLHTPKRSWSSAPA